ncbi:hypothetical protein DV737_g4562, partial [Chaetothyriales sp. CBS 132003]
MVNAGRVACIATPFILSLGALITLVLIFLAGTIDKSDTVDGFYFLKIDLSNLTVSGSSGSSLSGLSAISTLDSSSTNVTALGDALETAKDTLGVRDYYTLYLRSSCSWYAQNESQYANCTSPTSYWWFNPITAWGLNSTGTSVDELLSTSLREGLSTYHHTSKAVFLLYTAALTAVAATLLVGFTAIFSRWGSLLTTFFAGAAATLFVGASAVATALFVILRTVLNHNLRDDYSVYSSVGSRSLVLSWIGAAFALAAGFFWLLSVCFCSGRSPYGHGDGKRGGLRRTGTRAEKTPYTYERVGSPYLGPSDPHNLGQNIDSSIWSEASKANTANVELQFDSHATSSLRVEPNTDRKSKKPPPFAAKGQNIIARLKVTSSGGKVCVDRSPV